MEELGFKPGNLIPEFMILTFILCYPQLSKQNEQWYVHMTKYFAIFATNKQLKVRRVTDMGKYITYCFVDK